MPHHPAVQVPSMAKTPKKPPEEPEEPLPPTSTGRIDTELMRKARIICAHSKGRGGRNLKLSDYLDRLVRAQIEQDYERVMDEILKREQGKKS